MKVVPRTAGPASANLQGRKPREGIRWCCGVRYGDLSAASAVADCGRSDCGSCARAKRCMNRRWPKSPQQRSNQARKPVNSEQSCCSYAKGSSPQPNLVKLDGFHQSTAVADWKAWQAPALRSGISRISPRDVMTSFTTKLSDT